jgi:hypothetical protein
MGDVTDLHVHRIGKLRKQLGLPDPRPSDIGTVGVIEDAVAAMRGHNTVEEISDELLLAGVLVVDKELYDAGNETHTLAPYDRAIQHLIELREFVRECGGLTEAPVDTTWPR